MSVQIMHSMKILCKNTVRRVMSVHTNNAQYENIVHKYCEKSNECTNNAQYENIVNKE